MGMFYNGANCDLYIGKGAGKQLLEDIKNAKKSIKIISPYLSALLIKELLALFEDGLDIQLITTDEIEDFHNGEEKNNYKLIQQHRDIDHLAVSKREKWKVNAKRILLIAVLFLVLIVGATIYFEDFSILLGIIPIGILFNVFRRYQKKIKWQIIYNYRYSELFPFKVFMSPYKNKLSDTFIHSKVYVIDDEIAYLGSLNYTVRGTKDNYETRIRTTEKGAVDEILSEYNDLFNNSNIPEIDIETMGKRLYFEQIN